MLLIDLFCWITFVFLWWLVLLRFYIVINSFKGQVKDIEKRTYISRYQQNLNVIVYSHNNASTIIDLVEALKKQNYDKDKYTINVILDNCTDNSSKLLEILGGTRIWRINTDVKPIGKFKSIAWLLERILTAENTNAFVFLDADCIVKPDFLEKANNAVHDNPIVVGDILPINNDSDKKTGMLYLKNKFHSRVEIHGRCYGKLANILRNEVFAIRQDILEKVNFILTDYGFEEYEFSVKLSQSNIRIASSNQLRVYKQYTETLKSLAFEDYKERYKSYITLKNNLSLLFNKSRLRTKELILSLVYPSSFVFASIIFVLICLSEFNVSWYAALIGAKNTLAIYGWYLLANVLSLLAARCNSSDYKSALKLFFIKPVLFFMSVISPSFRVKFNLKVSLPGKFYVPRKDTRRVIDTTVTDGKKELACKLEVRDEDDYTQITFIFNDKKLSSTKLPCIDEALKELTEKLKTHGFALKVCMNCGYFKMDEMMAVKFLGQQGLCQFENVNKGSADQSNTYIWNTCPKIIPPQARNFVQKKLERNKTETETE